MNILWLHKYSCCAHGEQRKKDSCCAHGEQTEKYNCCAHGEQTDKLNWKHSCCAHDEQSEAQVMLVHVVMQACIDCIDWQLCLA